MFGYTWPVSWHNIVIRLSEHRSISVNAWFRQLRVVRCPNKIHLYLPK